MAKVSKNLKKLRVERGLTQDALAEQVFVTRQTVSSWETDRTQPDIEMLKSLAEALGVGLEELIYGEKRRTEETSHANTRKTLTVVFAILGSLLVGVGLVLIFVTGWENFPLGLKTVFTLLPMLVGQTAAALTYAKRRESLAWREGASVLWCAGMAATVALVNSVFSIDSGFNICLLLDALLFLPVIYVLDAATPLVAYYAAVLYCGFEDLADTRYPLFLPLLIVLVFAGLGYVLRNRKKTEDPRHMYTVWISVIAVSVLAVQCAIAFDFGILATVLACSLALLAADRDGSYRKPYRTLGLLGASATSVVGTFLLEPTDYSYYVDRYRVSEYAPLSVLLVAVIVAGGLLAGRRSFAHNPLKTAFCACVGGNILCAFLGETKALRGATVLYILATLLTFALAVLLITRGALSGKFIPLNLGLLMIAVQLAQFVLAQELGMLGNGILFVLLGSVLLLTNFFMARKQKREKQAEEVVGDA